MNWLLMSFIATLHRACLGEYEYAFLDMLNESVQNRKNKHSRHSNTIEKIQESVLLDVDRCILPGETRSNRVFVPLIIRRAFVL